MARYVRLAEFFQDYTKQTTHCWEELRRKLLPVKQVQTILSRHDNDPTYQNVANHSLPERRWNAAEGRAVFF